MVNSIDLSRIDLNLLVLFEIVFEERHVGRAAARLNLTSSAVSHALGRLRALFNDPLFLKTPKGVVPTARAGELAAPIATALAQVRSVVSTAEPFDAASSTRRFIVGAPDGTSAVFLSPLLAHLQRAAPGIDIGVRQLLPMAGETAPERAWRNAFDELESRAMDIAVVPSDHIPPRFHVQRLYEEDFVVAMRAGHPFAKDPSLKRYCAMRHLVVSLSGDSRSFVGEVMAKQGLSRRIALTVPNFMFALAVVAETDFLCALPRRLVAMHAARFGVVARESPIQLPRFSINAFVPKVAMMDAGLAWLFGALVQVQLSGGAPHKRSRKPRPSIPRS